MAAGRTLVTGSRDCSALVADAVMAAGRTLVTGSRDCSALVARAMWVGMGTTVYAVEANDDNGN